MLGLGPLFDLLSLVAPQERTPRIFVVQEATKIEIKSKNMADFFSVHLGV